MTQIGKLLLDHETHSRLFATGLLGCPHKFVIETSRKRLFYYGGRHSADSKHPQFVDIKKDWVDWVRKTVRWTRLAVVEGGVPPFYKSETEAIQSGEEPGYVSYLARLEHIEVISPEPTRKYMDRQLLKYFDKDEVQFQYFACVAWQYSTFYPEEKFREYLEGYLDYCRRESGWENYDFSLDHMNEICLRLTAKSMDKHTSKTWNDLINPYNRKSPLVSIARMDLDVRDAYIVGVLVKEFKQGKSLFVVYSYHHAYRQEPALKKLCS